MVSPETNMPADHSQRQDDEVGLYYEDANRAYWLAREYDADTPSGEFYRSRLTRIAGLLDGTGGELLDAGCGTGMMLSFLRKSRPDQFALTGLDRSASMIDAAKRVVADGAGIRFVVGRIEEMPFAADSFDVVLLMGSLEYVTSVEQALAEIARVTRPGGRVVVTMGNRWSPYRLWETMIWSHLRRHRGEVESPVVRRVDERRLRDDLERSGLKPVSVLRYGFNICVPPLDTRYPRFALRLERSLERLARGPICHVATDFAVVAERSRATATRPPRDTSPWTL